MLRVGGVSVVADVGNVSGSVEVDLIVQVLADKVVHVLHANCHVEQHGILKCLIFQPIIFLVIYRDQPFDLLTANRCWVAKSDPE